MADQPRTDAQAATTTKHPNRETVESLFAKHGDNYRWWATLTAGLGTLGTVLSSTSANVAIPEIMGAFGVGQDQGQWLSTGFLAASTVTMLLTAWVMSRFGARLAFIGALVIFIASSLMGAFATNFDVLVISRVIQGASSGIFIPMSMLILGKVFPPEKQGMAGGLFTLLVIMAPAVGPYIGGLLIDNFDWRAVFFLSLPIVTISIPMALRYLPNHDPNLPRLPLDWRGLVLLGSCLTLLLVMLTNGQKEGWESDYALWMYAGIILTGAAFIWCQLLADKPLLDLNLFKYGQFRLGVIISIIFGAGFFAAFYTVPLFLQTVQGLNATSSGLVLMPSGIALAIVGLLAGSLADKYSARALICTGFVIVIYSCWITREADAMTSFTTLVWWMVVGRLGLGMIMPPLMRSAMMELPPNLLPAASGALNFFRQMGGALGVNISAIYLNSRTIFHGDSIVATQHTGNEQLWDTASGLAEPLIAAGIDQATLPGVMAWLISTEMYKQAMTMAFQDTFLVLGIPFMLALIPAWRLKNQKT